MYNYKVSIDNLSIVGNIQGDPQTTLNKLAGMDFLGKSYTTPTGLFHYNFQSVIGGVFVQMSHESGHGGRNSTSKEVKLRVEFNPNKIRKFEKHVFQILKLMKHPHITRRDIAIDIIGEDLSNYQIYDLQKRKTIKYEDGNGKLETMYIGAKDSDLRIRIYNKALEQKVKDKEFYWWRVEAQMRGKRAEGLGENPFTKIKIVKKNDFDKHDLKTSAMLYYLQAFPEKFKKLSRPARAKYRKLLLEDIESVEIAVADKFDEAREELSVEVLSWLNFTEVIKDEEFWKQGKPQKSILTEIPPDWTEEDIERVRQAILGS
jgi:hypothetical protein